MKVRKVIPELQREAWNILSAVSEELDVPVRRIRAAWGGETHHNAETIRARKFCVYFIRSKTLLQRDLIAKMVGISRPSYISTIYREVYLKRKTDDKEREELQRIEQIIFNK